MSKAVTVPVPNKPKEDYADFGSYVTACSDMLATAYPRKRVSQDRLPPLAADRTPGTIAEVSVGTEPVQNSTGAIPLVTITGLDFTKHLDYLCVLMRSTIATVKAFCPTLSAAMLTPLGRTLVALVVAVRCGVWASTGIGPVVASHPVSACLQHRSDKSGVHRLALRRDTGLAQWYTAYTEVEPASPALEELMHRVAFIAPVLLDMQCAESTRQSSSYAIPYVQQAISRYLKAKLSKDAYPLAMLQRNVTWSTIRQASVMGMPVGAINHWATDAVFHNQAHRRLLTTRDELATSRRQEDALRAAQLPEALDYAADGVSVIDEDFITAVRSARPRALSDDMHTVADDSVWGDEDEDLSNNTYGHSPIKSPALSTALPSREPTPPPAMTKMEADGIRKAVQDAQGLGEMAASVVAGAQENLTIVW